MATNPQRFRAEDLPTMPVPDEILGYELVAGELLPVTPASPAHNRALGVIWTALLNYEAKTRSGRVFYDSWFKLGLLRDPEQVRAPDLGWVGKSKLGTLEQLPTMFNFAPDLAVEVFSPANERKTKDFQQRIRDYLDAGVPLLWIVYPDARYATVYHPDGSARLLREHETLDGEDVLPGLRISLEAVFQATELNL